MALSSLSALPNYRWIVDRCYTLTTSCAPAARGRDPGPGGLDHPGPGLPRAAWRSLRMRSQGSDRGFDLSVLAFEVLEADIKVPFPLCYVHSPASRLLDRLGAFQDFVDTRVARAELDFQNSRCRSPWLVCQSLARSRANLTRRT